MWQNVLLRLFPIQTFKYLGRFINLSHHPIPWQTSIPNAVIRQCMFHFMNDDYSIISQWVWSKVGDPPWIWHVSKCTNCQDGPCMLTLQQIIHVIQNLLLYNQHAFKLSPLITLLTAIMCPIETLWHLSTVTLVSLIGS